MFVHDVSVAGCHGSTKIEFLANGKFAWSSVDLSSERIGKMPNAPPNYLLECSTSVTNFRFCNVNIECCEARMRYGVATDVCQAALFYLAHHVPAHCGSC